MAWSRSLLTESRAEGSMEAQYTEEDLRQAFLCGVSEGAQHGNANAHETFTSGYMSRSLCDNNHRLSQLQSSRHVDSVGRDQLRIRHFGTQLDLLESGLFFRLGEKRQQVLASQPVG